MDCSTPGFRDQEAKIQKKLPPLRLTIHQTVKRDKKKRKASFVLQASKSYALLLFSHLVMSNSLQPHGLQHARPPCPSPSLKVCPSSCPLHWWCFLGISSSDTLFFCPQSFPVSGTFPMSQLFKSDDQNTGTSASASVLPTSIQGWFPLGLTGLISLLSQGLSGVFSSTTIRRHQFFGVLPSLWFRSHNSTWPLGRPNLTWLHLIDGT